MLIWAKYHPILKCTKIFYQKTFFYLCFAGNSIKAAKHDFLCVSTYSLWTRWFRKSSVTLWCHSLRCEFWLALTRLAPSNEPFRPAGGLPRELRMLIGLWAMLICWLRPPPTGFWALTICDRMAGVWVGGGSPRAAYAFCISACDGMGLFEGCWGVAILAIWVAWKINMRSVWTSRR